MRFTTILLCFAGVLGAQSTPVIHTETREVLVDAIVTGKNGAYIGDLTAKDFHISQDGKEQTIKGFAVESSSAASQTRSLVLFFDETSMEARDQIAVRQAAASFIDAEAGPNHRMAIVIFNGSMRIAQNFTDNAGRLKDALNQASFHGLAPSASDADNSHDPSRAEEARAVGRGGNGLATSFGTRNMIRSLAELGRSLGVLPGRKIVALFAGTLPSSTDPKSEVREAVDAANKSGVAFYPMDVRPVFAQSDPGAVQQTPALHSISIVPLGQAQGDPDASSSLIPDSGASGQQVLFNLANGTGGLVVRNTADLLGGLQKIAQEQDQYYVLTYVAPESKEGSCHALRVKVDRKQTTVRSRTTYCADKPLDLLAGTTAGKELENRAAGADAGGIGASMQLSFFYISPRLARVKLAMEIPLGGLKFENRKGKLHAEVNFLGVASTTPDGAVGARFSDALKLDYDSQAQIEGLRGKPLHYEKEFKIAPGHYNFTLAFNSGGENFGKLQAPLAVDARVPGELAMSGLVLSKETQPAAELGLGAAGSLVEDRTPLVAEGVQMIPSGSNQFTKSEIGFFYFEVYAPDPAAARVRIRVLDRKTGEAKSDTGLLKLDLPQGGSAEAVPAGSKLPVDALADGSYELEVTASDTAGKQVKRTADFEKK
jgi:VWFA-related protein